MLAGGKIVAFIFKITHCNYITIHFTSCMPATSRLRSGRIFMPIISPIVLQKHYSLASNYMYM